MEKDEKEQMGLNLRNDMWKAIHSIQAEHWDVSEILLNFEAYDLYSFTMSTFDPSSYLDFDRPRFMGHELKLSTELCYPSSHQDIPLFPTLKRMAEIESVPDVRVIGRIPDRIAHV